MALTQEAFLSRVEIIKTKDSFIVQPQITKNIYEDGVFLSSSVSRASIAKDDDYSMHDQLVVGICDRVFGIN